VVGVHRGRIDLEELMRGPWTDVGLMHRAFAEVDVRFDGTPLPRLIGFAGDEPLAMVTLRPFDPGEALGPMIEALAFLLPFGANRISAGFPGRGWSLDDPIPPVTDEVDLRQRIVVEMRVVQDATVSSCLHPFAINDGAIVWEEPLDLGPPEGHLAHALAVTMAGRHTVRVGPGDILEQLARMGVRGHELAVAPQGAVWLERLALDADSGGRAWEIHQAD